MTTGTTGFELETGLTEIFDIHDGMHYCVDSLPSYEVSYASGGLLHGKYPLICGGDSGAGTFSDECDIIPNVEGISSPMLPYPISHAGYAVVNDSILWITGGVIHNITEDEYLYTHSTLFVEVYGPSGWSVYPGPDLPNTNWFHCMVNSDELMKAFSIGGMDEQYAALNGTQIFNSNDQTWEHGPSLMEPRADFGCGLLKDGNDHILIAVGGYNWFGISNTVEMYNIDSGGGWYVGPVLSQPRSVKFPKLC